MSKIWHHIYCEHNFVYIVGRPKKLNFDIRNSTVFDSLVVSHDCQDNEYQQAIRSVASVLAPYDSDQMIPVYGFGARLPPDGRVSHCFPLNFNDSNPEVHGVQVHNTQLWHHM